MRVTRFCFARPSVKTNFDVEDFLPTPKNALSNSLAQLASRGKRKKPQVPNSKINVVSSSLCNDALKLLSPSLAAYKGCELFDINPMGGLWSSRLSEYLKPSKHNIIQSAADAAYYQGVAAPHLASCQNIESHIYQTGESARSGLETELTKKLNFAEKDLLDSLWLKPHAADTIVVTANYGQLLRSRRLLAESNRVHSPARSVIERLNDVLQRNAEVFKGKKVRFLLWTLETEVMHFLPNVLANRRLFAMNMQHHYEVLQLVNSRSQRDRSERTAYQTIQSALWAARRMLESGITLPPNRQSPLHKEAVTQLSASSNLPQDTQLQHDIDFYLVTLRRLYHREITTKLPKVIIDETTRTRKEFSPEWQRMLEIQANFSRLVGFEGTSIQPKTDRLRHSSAFFDLHETSYALEAAQSSGTAPQGLLSDLEQKAASTIAAIRNTDADLGTARKLLWEGKRSRVDNHLALYRPSPDPTLNTITPVNPSQANSIPPIFPWDIRPHEPLLSSADEFYPRIPLSLLSFELKPNASPSPFDDPFVRSLFLHRQHFLTQTLDNLVLGAAEALIPRCPAVTTPSRGGTRYPEYMSTLLLTDEMLWELRAAWEEYAFRLTEQQLRSMDVSNREWHNAEDPEPAGK